MPMDDEMGKTEQPPRQVLGLGSHSHTYKLCISVLRSMEDLQARHRKEQRDLQSRITQKKKCATKKTRKTINDECATLEHDLGEKQAQEIAELNGKRANNDDETSSVQPQEEDNPETNQPEHSDDAAPTTAGTNGGIKQDQQADAHEQFAQQRKPSRQKARLARRAAEQEALAAQGADEAANLPNLRAQEQKKMQTQFEKRGLREKEIRADGHCLYSAVADQMDQLGIGLRPGVQPSVASAIEGSTTALPPYKLVREIAADHISTHADDFLPFLEEPMELYVSKIKDTGEWGGQLELLALAKAYGVNINVLQGDGRVEKIPGGDGEGTQEIWLAYYKHNFGLGEHYNSLRKAP